MMNSKYSVVDDKGLSFLNLGTMLEYYKVTSVDYLEKSDKGVSLSEILSKPSEFYAYRLYRDAFGSYFKDLDAMCSVYEVDKYEYLRRIAIGWCVGAALSKTGGKTPRTEYIAFTEEEEEDYKDRCKLAKESSDRLKACMSVYYIEKRCTEIRYRDRQIMKSRRLNGLTVVDKGNLIKRKANCNGKACVDFNGNEFVSIVAMCRHYQIEPDVFYRRREKGFSLKDCLTADKYALRTNGDENFSNGYYTDHNGDKYETLEDMCSHWGISVNTYKKRCLNGKTLKETLETPMSRTLPVDHKGIRYKNMREMCEAYGVKYDAFRVRLKRGWTLEEALTNPRNVTKGNCIECYDFKGNKFKSYQDMCKAYGVKYTTFLYRKNLGWTLEECLLSTGVNKCYCAMEDHLGNKFVSKAELCRTWGISPEILKYRIEKGLSLKDSLELVKISSETRLPTRDLADKAYNSCIELCKSLGISIERLRTLMSDGVTAKEAIAKLKFDL